MKNIQGAVEDIKKLAAFINNLLEFANSIESVGSVDQAAKEAQGRIEAAKKEETLVSQNLVGLKASVAVVEDDLAKKKAEAIAQSERVIKVAEEKAQKIVDNATASIQERIIMLGEKKDAIEAAIIAHQEHLALIKDEKAKEQASLDELKSEMAALKAKLGI